MVKTAVTGATSSSDPITFKPNPNNLVSQLPEQGSNSEASESSEDDTDDDSKRKKSSGSKSESKTGVYVPPKLTAVHYDGDETKAERERKMLERARKRALS